MKEYYITSKFAKGNKPEFYWASRSKFQKLQKRNMLTFTTSYAINTTQFMANCGSTAQVLQQIHFKEKKDMEGQPVDQKRFKQYMNIFFLTARLDESI